MLASGGNSRSNAQYPRSDTTESLYGARLTRRQGRGGENIRDVTMLALTSTPPRLKNPLDSLQAPIPSVACATDIGCGPI